jgi:hypothetical protein
VSQVENLRADAHRLIDDGHYMAGHLALLQAAHEAQQLGDLESRIKCLIEALIAGGKANIKPSKQLKLLIDIRTQMFDRPDAIPQNTNFDPQGYIEREYFNHLVDYNPVRQELEEVLRTMRGVHPADAHSLWKRYHSLIGDDASALDSAEKAWAAYEDARHDGSSLRPGSIQHRPVYLLGGFYSELAMGEKHKAEQWLNGAVRELNSYPCPNCQLNYLNAKMAFALATASPLVELKALMRETEAQASRLERSPSTNFLSVRVLLLDPVNGDPHAKSHPAYRALCSRLEGDGTDLETRYSRALLALDFRLAALRHCADISPVDDLYYATPQDPDRPKRGRFSWHKLKRALGPGHGGTTRERPPCDFDDRIRKTQAAAQSAMRHAKRLDSLLECSWRQRSVQNRIERIDEIVQSASVTALQI